MKKGISEVVAVILLLLITVAIVGFAYVFFQRLQSTATNATSTQLNSQISQEAKTINIENMNPGASTVYIRSNGPTAPNSNEINLYVNGVLTQCLSNLGWANVSAGSTTSCKWSNSACAGGTPIIVTTPGGSYQTTC